MKMAKIGDFLTESEIRLAIKLKRAEAIKEQIILPNLERINLALGQENDAMYLAFIVEFVIDEGRRQ